MKLAIGREWTAGELLEELENLDPNETIEFTRSKTQKSGKCWCNCGLDTKSRFVPGHDAKFHSLGRRVGRDESDMPTEWACKDAEADFMKHVEEGRKQGPRTKKVAEPLDLEPIDDEFMQQFE